MCACLKSQQTQLGKLDKWHSLARGNFAKHDVPLSADKVVISALRWIMRGLIKSGHVTDLEPLATDVSSGVIMTNDIYYWDANLHPFETLDLKELQRKKRANKDLDEESEEDIEMSEYEKMRAERVARNAERLKALGLV